MNRLSILAVIGLLFALTSPAAATTPGDVGTLECRAVQLEAQEAVSSGGPYKNNGQLVKTAAAVVSPAEESGEITAACSSCIMNQFGRKVPIEDQETCGPDLCAVSGGPGWENVVRPGGGGVATGDTTAQECCQACVDNPNCAQWAFVGGSFCSHNVGTVCVGDLTPFTEGGIIRCP